MTLYHWVAIVVVTFGLMISAFGSATQHTSESTPMIGIFFSFAATITFSFHYIATEYILTTTPVDGKRLQTLCGFYDAALVTAYLLLYTIPNFQVLVFDSILI
jgi:hypothetical protein